MINNDHSTLLLYCCEDVKSHSSGGDTVPLNVTNLHKYYEQGKNHLDIYICKSQIYFHNCYLYILLVMYRIRLYLK